MTVEGLSGFNVYEKSVVGFRIVRKGWARKKKRLSLCSNAEPPAALSMA